MRIVVTGGTGSIGRKLIPGLLARGERVTAVTRRPRDARRLFGPEVEVVAGDCACPGPWQRALDGAQAVIHLAGAGIADRRWSRRYRDVIESSRIDSTHQVVAAIGDADARPAVLIVASATGYYGDAGDEMITERFPPGKGFLADVCVRWEDEAKKAASFGVRVVRARFGVVLDEHGPALRRALPWFRAGLGPILGTGRQWLPWIHHRDCTAAIIACVDGEAIEGPVNITAPEPCTNRQFARTLGRAVLRPVFVHVPRAVLRTAIGGFAEELFRSQRAVPAVLEAAGFTFFAPTIERCFDLLLEEDPAPKSAASTRRIASAAAGTLPKPVRPPARPRLLIVSAEAAIDDGHGRLRPGVREAIRAASSHGCAVVVATDRASSAARELLLEPLLHPTAIVANGAVLWNAREGAANYIERIEHGTLAAVALAARRAAPRSVLLFEGDDWLASDVEIPAELGRLTLRLATGELPPKPVARLHVVDVPEALGAVRQAIETPFWRERKIAIFQRGGLRLTIASPLVDRAVAAQRIARRLGATRDEIMALVGEQDDLGLADWCGFAVAIADAPDAVRRLAGATLPATDDELGAAVAAYLANV
ncbi:MAG: TIGR01777 family oxidoreductase [Phycisphaerae bacterium]|nr:TIGR01777 family oxidoreductase [Phycisphaerae bacterium]